MKPFHAPSKEALAVSLVIRELKREVCIENLKFKATHGKLNSKILYAYWTDGTGSSWWDGFTRRNGKERV